MKTGSVSLSASSGNDPGLRSGNPRRCGEKVGTMIFVHQHKGLTPAAAGSGCCHHYRGCLGKFKLCIDEVDIELGLQYHRAA